MEVLSPHHLSKTSHTKSLCQGSNQISKGFRWPSQNTTEPAFSTPCGISMRLSVGKLRHPAMK